MKISTLVPTSRNDGSAVSPKESAELIEILWRPFGGFTNEGLVSGSWIDPQDGQEYHDQSIKVSIAIDSLDDLFKAIDAVKEIGRRLDQKAMYLELTGSDGPYFLRTDSN